MKTAQTIAIHESAKSEKVVAFCTGYYELIKYASEKQAKRILHAAENGMLWGCFLDKNGKLRTKYI